MIPEAGQAAPVATTMFGTAQTKKRSRRKILLNGNCAAVLSADGGMEMSYLEWGVAGLRRLGFRLACSSGAVFASEYQTYVEQAAGFQSSARRDGWVVLIGQARRRAPQP